MKTAHERQALINDVLREVVPVAAAKDRAARRRQAAETAAATKHCNRFISKMESSSPFESEDEAIMTLAPIAVWFIGWAARQLAILVIKAIWRRWQASGSHA